MLNLLLCCCNVKLLSAKVSNYIAWSKYQNGVTALNSVQDSLTSLARSACNTVWNIAQSMNSFQSTLKLLISLLCHLYYGDIQIHLMADYCYIILSFVSRCSEWADLDSHVPLFSTKWPFKIMCLMPAVSNPLSWWKEDVTVYLQHHTLWLHLYNHTGKNTRRNLFQK